MYQELERDEVRGTKGPHPIFRLPDEKLGKIQKAFIQGAKEQGHKEVMDLNAPDAEGVGPSTVCRAGDKRFSLANTFIDPIRSSQKNLTILDNVLVEKIVFENERVAGVQTSDDVIRASTEVILSAGAILSPAILQRSQIGSPSLLKKHRIQEISNPPVGSNAYDHPCIPIVAKPRLGAYNKDDYSLQSQARFSSSFQPGAVDHQLVYFSFLFASKPDPRVQQRSLAGTTSGHVAEIGYNLSKPTSLRCDFHPKFRRKRLACRRSSIAHFTIRPCFRKGTGLSCL